MANEYLTVQQAQYLLSKWASEYVPNQNGILVSPTLNGSISIGGTPTFSSSSVAGDWLSAMNGVKANFNSVTPSNVSCAPSADTTLCSVALPIGWNIVLAMASFPNNSNGRRVIYFTSSTTSTSVIDRFCKVAQLPVASDSTVVQLTTIRKTTSAETIYLRAYHNSGSTLSVQCGIRYINLS